MRRTVHPKLSAEYIAARDSSLNYAKAKQILEKHYDANRQVPWTDIRWAKEYERAHHAWVMEWNEKSLKKKVVSQ